MTDQPTKPLMTPVRAEQLLKEILAWRLQIVLPQPDIRSTPTDTDGIRSSRSERLDFGLDQVIDTTASDGPRGTTTYEGVDKWLRFWVPWMSYWTGQPAVFRREPGAWFLAQLQGSEALAAVAEWDEDDQTAWREFTSELTTMWWRVATLTGHAPLTRGLCPKCQTGKLLSYPRYKQGYDDKAQCSKCGVTVDYTAFHQPEPLTEVEAEAIERAQEQTRASFRAALRDPDLTSTWLTHTQVQAVWPRLKLATLRSWVHRQQVRKKHGLYNLGDINACILPSPPV